MSDFTKISLIMILLAVIGEYIVDIKNYELRSNKCYRIFVIICGIVAFIVVSIVCYKFLIFLLSIINYFKDILLYG